MTPAADLATFAARIEEQGWAVTPPRVGPAALARLAAAVAPAATVGRGRGGARNLLDLPAVCECALSDAVWPVAVAVLGPACVAVRGLLFDKSAAANWAVPWHRDVTIAVAGRVDTLGYGPWSAKAGVTHVQPPNAVMERILAVRIHLDPCGPDNGPVRVLPGSHRLTNGPVPEPAECVAEAGAILAFRPLILHASSPATRPARRRVIHLEYAAVELPAGLAWRWAVGRVGPAAGGGILG